MFMFILNCLDSNNYFSLVILACLDIAAAGKAVVVYFVLAFQPAGQIMMT